PQYIGFFGPSTHGADPSPQYTGTRGVPREVESEPPIMLHVKPVMYISSKDVWPWKNQAQVHFPFLQFGILAGTSNVVRIVFTHSVLTENMTKSSGWTEK